MGILRIKIRYILAALLVLLVAIGVIYYVNRPGKLLITTEPGATIAISRDQGEQPKAIGIGEATYSSRDIDRPVYVEVTKDGKKTISGSVLVRGATKQLKLGLADKTTVRTVADGGVLYARLDGNLVQGILPFDGMATSFRTDIYETTRAELVGLPYMQKIIWYDANNFVYLPSSLGAGRVVNGQDEADQNLARNGGADLTKEGDSNSELGSGGPFFIDIAGFPGKPLVLLTNQAIAISKDMGETVSLLAEPVGASRNSSVFATPDRIVWLSNNRPSGIEDDGNGSEIIEYDYTGKQIRSYTAPGELIISITTLGDKTYILTDTKLIVRDDEGQSTVPLYFKYAADIAWYENTVVLLADSAIWKVADNGSAVQLLAEFTESGVGLRGSLSINPTGELLFSSTASLEQTDTVGKLLSVTF